MSVELFYCAALLEIPKGIQCCHCHCHCYWYYGCEWVPCSNCLAVLFFFLGILLPLPLPLPLHGCPCPIVGQFF